jgi:hypothetical protein
MKKSSEIKNYSLFAYLNFTMETQRKGSVVKKLFKFHENRNLHPFIVFSFTKEL